MKALKGFHWYRIAANTAIPEGLAVTRDAGLHAKDPVHYTVSPKDDMPQSSYLVQLRALAKDAQKL